MKVRSLTTTEDRAICLDINQRVYSPDSDDRLHSFRLGILYCERKKGARKGREEGSAVFEVKSLAIANPPDIPPVFQPRHEACNIMSCNSQLPNHSSREEPSRPSP